MSASSVFTSAICFAEVNQATPIDVRPPVLIKSFSNEQQPGSKGGPHQQVDIPFQTTTCTPFSPYPSAPITPQPIVLTPPFSPYPSAPMTPLPICLVFMSPKGGTPRIHSLGRHDTGPSFCIHHHPPTNPHPPHLSPYPSAPMTPLPICLVFMSPKGGTPRIHSLGRHDTGPSFCIHHHHPPTYPHPPPSVPTHQPP